jgi:hypothetical protein
MTHGQLIGLLDVDDIRPGTSIGTASDGPGAAVTISGVTVSAGSLIVVWAFEKSTNSANGTITDSVGNIYNPVAQNSPNSNIALGAAEFFYAWNSIAINNGTITYTKNTSGVGAEISAFSATGIRSASNPLDSVFTGANTGLSASPTISSPSPPALSNSLIVGGVAWVWVAGDMFTQDSTNGPWSAPPNALLGGVPNAAIVGGKFIESVPAFTTYAPTLNNSRAWTASIIAFKPAP